MAGAIGRGLGVGLGGGDGDASAVPLATTVGLGVADAIGGRLADGLGVGALEQATTANDSKKMEPIRARRRVRTLFSWIILAQQIIYSAVAP